MLDSENIRNYYRTLDEHALLELARNPKGVRPEIVSVLLESLKERNVGVELVESILLETNYFLNDERESLIQIIKESECTKCNISRSLNGYSFRTITSFVISKHENYEKQIICSSCALKKELKSFLLHYYLDGGLGEDFYGHQLHCFANSEMYSFANQLVRISSRILLTTILYVLGN